LHGLGSCTSALRHHTNTLKQCPNSGLHCSVVKSNAYWDWSLHQLGVDGLGVRACILLPQPAKNPSVPLANTQVSLWPRHKTKHFLDGCLDSTTMSRPAPEISVTAYECQAHTGVPESLFRPSRHASTVLSYNPSHIRFDTGIAKC
jgi:hypothetical protein